MGKRIRNVVIGLIVLAVGVAGLLLPVAVWNGGDATVACGNAITAEPPRADGQPEDGTFMGQPVPHPDVAAQCSSAISDRRHWALPLVAVGAIGLLIGLLYRGRTSSRPGG